MLNLDLADRRRLLLAAAVTVIALPTIWFFTRSTPSGRSAGSSVAVAGATETSGPTDSGDAVFDTTDPIFVDGPTTPPKPAVVQIVVPAQVEQGHIDGGATYKRTIGDRPDTCAAPNAPFNRKLTVTNRDNGRSITCVNRAAQSLGKGLEIMLTTDAFGQIAQLIDAPVPVRISWQGNE